MVATVEGERVFTSCGADQPDRIMLEQISEGAASLSAERIVLYANHRLAEMLEIPLPTLVGSPIDQFITREQQPALVNLFRSPACASRRSGEFTLTADGGRLVEAHVSLTPLPEGTGAAWCMIAADVTERAQRLAAIVESSVDAIISLSNDGLIEAWNTGAERLYGYTAAQAIGQHAPTLLAADPAERQPLLAHVVQSASAVQVESQDVHKDGSLVDVAVTDSPIRDLGGRVIGIARTTHDVTARKHADRELERLAQAAEHSSDAIVSFDLELRVRHWNPGAERLYGHSANEVFGRAIDEVHGLTIESEQAPTGWRDAVASVLGRGSPYQFEAQRRHTDGTLLDVLVKSTPWHVDGRVVGMTTIANDISERKRVERAREQALADLEEAQRLARLGSWTWDPSTDAITWSAQMYEIYGRDAALGTPTRADAIAYVHPDDRERVEAAFATALGGQATLEHEHRLIGGDGVNRTVRIIGQLDQARIGCYVGTVQDVTDQRRAEQERIELLEASARAESANKAKSEFLARMSHELRTPLNSIVGFSQLVEMDGLTPSQRENIGYVRKAGSHLLELINEVLELARIEVGHMTISPEPVLLDDTIREALALVAPLADERDIALNIDSAGLGPDRHVRADRHRLKQVLLNVLSNAIKYNRTGGRVDIRFASGAGRVRTTIADTGLGMRPEQLAKLFEPFERLGAEYTQVEGTGLGLALSKSLAEAMGGTIEVDSESGVGSAFTIELAAAQRPSIGHRTRLHDRALTELGGEDGKRQVILYIEDNLSNLTLLERLLKRYPAIELIPAMQGTIGLELAREHRPDLIILDLHLPDMHGAGRPQAPQGGASDERDSGRRADCRREQGAVRARQATRCGRLPHKAARHRPIPEGDGNPSRWPSRRIRLDQRAHMNRPRPPVGRQTRCANLLGV